MNNTKVVTELRRIFWPIERHENKKFLPMALMMFCILFNYATLRSIKDGLIVTNIGAEALSFIKMYMVLPSAIIAMLIYTELCNLIQQRKIFYLVNIFFSLYFLIFAFVLYPNPQFFHPNEDLINELVTAYPYFKWFIKIAGHWSYASFYVMSELYGAMMLSLLFWQFANKITKTSEAKRFYSMFGLLGNCSLPLIAIALGYLLNEKINLVSKDFKFVPIVCLVVFNNFVVKITYSWIGRNVLTDPTLYTSSESSTSKKKPHLSFKDSIKMILASKYIKLLTILVFSYGVSISLVEGVWKSKIKALYTTEESYTVFMGNFQAYQGFAAIFFMIIGSNILRKVSWRTAAMFTPIMILATGVAFFTFIFLDHTIGLYLAMLIGTGPVAITVAIGTIQNVLSKATKYSLFDSTKEMAYIPLDKEMKTKGKAAVDVIGGRLGKSGGGFIQSTLFWLVPTYGFAEAAPYFASMFFVIVILWIYAVNALNKEYTKVVTSDH